MALLPLARRSLGVRERLARRAVHERPCVYARIQNAYETESVFWKAAYFKAHSIKQ